MKKIVFIVTSAVLMAASFSLAGNDMKTEESKELRPLQKIMRARAGWMKAMNENLVTRKLADVSKDAEELSAQAKKVGEGAANPLAKELHLAVSSLAKETSVAALNNDEAAVKVKLAEVKAKCAECHAKIRDKK